MCGQHKPAEKPCGTRSDDDRAKTHGYGAGAWETVLNGLYGGYISVFFSAQKRGFIRDLKRNGIAVAELRLFSGIQGFLCDCKLLQILWLKGQLFGHLFQKVLRTVVYGEF